MSENLRTLAQAVVDAWRDRRDDKPQRTLALALNISEDGDVVTAAEAILAVDAQGYARAMGEVMERCEAEARACHELRLYARADAEECTARWARERLPAAADD